MSRRDTIPHSDDEIADTREGSQPECERDVGPNSFESPCQNVDVRKVPLSVNKGETFSVKADYHSLADVSEGLSVETLPDELSVLCSSEAKLIIGKLDQIKGQRPVVSGSVIIHRDLTFEMFGAADTNLTLNSEEEDIFATNGVLKTKEQLSDLLNILMEYM